METVEINNLIYSLNKKEKEANIIGNSFNNNECQADEIIIPRSIFLDSTEYIIKKISKCAFELSNKIKSICFAADSEIRIIEENVFLCSSVECITIPQSLVELKEGWCNSTQSLIKIKVMKNNPKYSLYEDTFIIGKSSIDQDNFDVLIFCNRDVEKVTIPNFIEIIGSYSFNQCYKLQHVEIQNDSKLKIIEKDAFSFSSIESISIPHHITHICECAFFSCYQLNDVGIPSNSNLQVIEKEAFNSTSISSINIPSSVIELVDGFISKCFQLNWINIMKNNEQYKAYENKILFGKTSVEQEDFNVLIFSLLNVTEVVIPDYIQIIGQHAFVSCMHLKKVEFSVNSKLEIIDDYAFCCSNIKRISIPSNVEKINDYVFSSCFELQRIDIPEDSKLHSIGEKAFFSSPIICFSIPSSVKIIGELAFYNCSELQIIEFNENSNIEHIDQNIFLNCYKVAIMIPFKFRDDFHNN